MSRVRLAELFAIWPRGRAVREMFGLFSYSLGFLVLVAELALHRRDGAVASMVWLTTERGTPFGSAASFGNWFAKQCRAAGVPGRAHGLRKASAIRLALRGAPPYELMAWHGWKSIKEAQEYVEQANRMKLADNAADRLISGT